MSRARNFVHAVWSGYAMTAVVSLLNLVTIPVACAAIGKPAWGLWCSVVYFASFTSIFDLGLGPSLGRFIADYKDDPHSGAYAGFLKSVFLVGVVQGALFSLAVVCLIPYLPGLMGIPAEEFRSVSRRLPDTQGHLRSFRQSKGNEASCRARRHRLRLIR